MTKAKVRLDHVRLGFEAECIVDNRKLATSGMSITDALSIAIGHEEKISSYLGNGKQHEGVDYSVWNLMDDTTIIPPHSQCLGVEIVSPVMEYTRFSDALNRTFAYIGDYGSTNDSCGLHIGVSLDGVSLAENLDVLKLILFIGEAHIASSFARFDNTYAKRIEPYIATYLSSFHDIVAHIKELVSRPLYPVTPGVQSVIPWDKYFSLNFTKIESSNYIEFRLVGGADYHTKAQEIQAIARRLAWAVSVACDPEAHKAEYATKLLRFAHASRDTGHTASNIKLVPTGAGSYTVEIHPPMSFESTRCLSLQTARTSAGTYDIVSCSDDSLRSSYSLGLYTALTEGIGGAVRLSIAPNATREVSWLCDDLVASVTNPQRLLYLVTACPSIIPALSKETLSKLFGLARDQATRSAIHRALEKLPFDRVFDSYLSLGLVPLKADPMQVASSAESAGVSLESLINDSVLAAPMEMRSLVLALGYQTGNIADIFSILASNEPAPWVVSHPDDTAEDLLRFCTTDNKHGESRNRIVDYLTKLMRHSTAQENRFLYSLLEAAPVYENQFLMGLADTLSHKNVDTSWIECLHSA